MKNRHRKPDHKVGFFEMVQTIFTASFNRGQIIPFMIGMIIMTIIIKMPSSDVSKLAFEILSEFATLHLVGYGIGIFSTLGWFIHARSQRRVISREMERIGREKSQLQSKKLGGDVKSSE